MQLYAIIQYNVVISKQYISSVESQKGIIAIDFVQQ